MEVTSRPSLLDRIGRFMAGKLEREVSGYVPFTRTDTETILKTLRPADIILVEGNRKVSSIIKYLTQSTWSHAAIYIADQAPEAWKNEFGAQGEHCLIEVNLGEGCVVKPLSKYESYNIRICRPVGLTQKDSETVVRFMVDRIGLQYDHSNIFDMLRYFFPIPIPRRFRRRMIALGAGDPSRAICSTLIALAFQNVKYPILPVYEDLDEETCNEDDCYQEILHIRHHSLFAPRDFDLSPYFAVVKPTIEAGFDYKSLRWSGEVANFDPLDKTGAIEFALSEKRQNEQTDLS